ncbi:MAG: hypothetical protein ABJO67_09350 [Pseudoruegeria sp.]
MTIDLISTITFGFCGAGIVLLLNHLFKGRLPKWLMPVAAGAMMLGFTIWSEYSWFDRTKALLPAGIELAQTYESKAFYRPWTYATPYVNRFSAVDVANLRHNENIDSQVMADLYLYTRWQQLSRLPVLIDCTETAMAELVEGAQFDANGAVIDADWQSLPSDDPILRLSCTA